MENQGKYTKLAKFFYLFSQIWGIGVGIIIAIGLFGILFTDGFRAMLAVINPFNLANFLVIIILLSPALLFQWIATRLMR